MYNYMTICVCVYIYRVHTKTQTSAAFPCKPTWPTVGSKKLNDGVRRILAGIVNAFFPKP